MGEERNPGYLEGLPKGTKKFRQVPHLNGLSVLFTLLRWVTCWMFFAAAGPLAAEQPLLEGQVRLRSGEPVTNALVALFDVANLRSGVVAYATTDATGYFTLPVSTRPGSVLPQQFTLGQNYPNPFNPSTVIPYQLASAAHVRLEVFNVLGQRLATLVDGVRPAGSHTARWDATDTAGQAVGAGVYIYRLSSAGQMQSRRMVLIDGQAGVASVGAMPERQLSADADETPVYGLAVAGAGLIAYVDAAFRLEAGVGPVEIVVEAAESAPRGKVTADEILGDVNNDGRVDLADVLLVMMYSLDASINIPNIHLGDMNNDGRVELIDAYLLVNHILGQSDSSSLDPSAPVNLTNHFRHDESPDWSPDGSRIAFVSDRDGNKEIYVMDTDGQNPTNLTNNDSDDWNAVWSPNGRRIAFISNRDGNWQIYVMDADGGNPTRFAKTSTNYHESPDWSPDGSRIAYISKKKAEAVWGYLWIGYVDSESDKDWIGSSRECCSSPVWSPSGRRIAYHTSRRIYSSDSALRDEESLAAYAWGAVWSPSGRRIAYITSSSIYVMDADGSNRFRRLFTERGSSTVFRSSLAWSPDGLRLVFVSDREGNDEIYMMIAHPKTEDEAAVITNLTNNESDDRSPVWSPDGSRIAFQSLRDGNWEIYVTTVD